VLGAILERVSSRSFDTLLNSRIAGPAGLPTLKIAHPGATPRMTKGFSKTGAPEAPLSLATFGPAGAAYGSPEDLLRFDEALLDGRILAAPERATAWKGDPHFGYVALGVWSFPAPLQVCSGAVDLVERRGEIGGVEVRNLLAPELGKALVVFADKAGLDFGKIWQGKGLSYRLASAAFCAA